MAEAFYERAGEGPDGGGRDGERCVATGLTRGPWDPAAQHAGPPAALLAREIERLPDAAEFQVGRVTCEILGPVPIGPVEVSARVVRPGRRVQLVEAELGDGERTLMRASAWRLRTAPLELPADLPAGPQPPPGPEQGREVDFFPTGEDEGYHSAMEVRFLEGAFLEPGPARVWLRMRHPLLEGEEPSPLQRTMIVADVGNGVSATLDYRRFLFINVDLTVHLERMPAGEWICVDAVTLPQPNGVGTAESVLFDREGRVGRAVQTLLVSGR